MAAEYDLFWVPAGKLVVVIAILARHGEASSNTRSRSNGGVFIIPCWRECGKFGEIAKVSELIRGLETSTQRGRSATGSPKTARGFQAGDVSGQQKGRQIPHPLA